MPVGIGALSLAHFYEYPQQSLIFSYCLVFFWASKLTHFTSCSFALCWEIAWSFRCMNSILHSGVHEYVLDFLFFFGQQNWPILHLALLHCADKLSVLSECVNSILDSAIHEYAPVCYNDDSFTFLGNRALPDDNCCGNYMCVSVVFFFHKLPISLLPWMNCASSASIWFLYGLLLFLRCSCALPLF